MKLLALLVITVIALLLGAGLALMGYAMTYTAGSARWEQLMNIGGALTAASAGIGLVWALLPYIRKRPRN